MKKNYLAKAITLSLALGLGASVVLPQCVKAEEAAANPILTRTETIKFDNNAFVTLKYYEKGTYKDDDEIVGLRCISTNEHASLLKGLQYWYRVLGTPVNGVPIIDFYPEVTNGINAGAGSDTSDAGDVTRLATYFIEGMSPASGTIAEIAVENGSTTSPWYYDRLPVLPVNGTASDYAGTIVHEMFHALGVTSNLEDPAGPKNDDNQSDKYTDQRKYDVTKLTNYAKLLRDVNGKSLVECTTHEIKLVEKASEAAQYAGQYFCVISGNKDGQEVNSAEIHANRYGGVYLASRDAEGKLTNIGKVLNSSTDENATDVKIAWPDDSNLAAVAGIPINCVEYEQDDDGKVKGYEIDLSHFELQNSLQSHQNYRNYCIPLEVELAALQDMGYTIDLSKFYGRSIYASGTASQQNTVNNTTGYEKSQAWGIGLHVYGSYNDVTQNADIAASGEEALGIRVDGVNNNLTINKAVSADGTNGRAIAFTYGKNHTLTINSGVKVAAAGAGGKALSFDFGSNELGDNSEIRGSYIRAKGSDSEALLTALQGPLMQSVDINGVIAGETAIYISNNALVKNINIKTGAQISGNIVDDWENAGVTGLQLPDSENGMTTITFQNSSYDGNVSNSLGSNASTVNLNIKNNNFSYNGTANVNKVNIDSNKTMTLNSQGALFANSVGGEGKLDVHGTLGAVTPVDEDTTMTVFSNLVLENNSEVQFTGNVLGLEQKTGVIEVADSTNLEQKGSSKIRLNQTGTYLPGNYSVFKQGGEDKTLNVTDTNAGSKGLLQATYNKQTAKLDIAVNSNNNILTSEQTRAVQAVEADRVSNSVKYADGLSSAEKARYVNFLNTSDQAVQRRVARDFTSNASAQATQAVQHSNLIERVVHTRLASVNNAKVTVPVQATPKALTTNKDVAKQTVTTEVSVPVQPENSFWAKVDRSWGDAGAMNMHSTGLTFGYDKAYNEHNRAGVLLSYADGSVSGAEKLDKIKDYRVGVYNNFHNGADDVTVYLDYGKQKHDAKRYIVLRDNAAQNDYNSKILELGAEYKHDLHANDGKNFHVAPYVNTQLSRYWQNGYNEGIFGHNVNNFSGNYFTTGLGVEFNRFFKQGNYSARLGYKRVWDGSSTTLNYNLGGMGFEATSQLDKNFVTAGLTGTTKLNNHGWSLEGDSHIEKGAHDKNYGVSATLKWEW